MTVLNNIKDIIETQIRRLKDHSSTRDLTREELGNLSEIMINLNRYNEELSKYNISRQFEKQAEYDKNNPLLSR